MTSCCRMGRSYVLLNGKIAALFVDVDGTIAECQPYYDSAIERFGFLMTMCGFAREHSVTTLREIDLSNSHSHGFERDRFPNSMKATYAKLCADASVEVKPEISDLCQDIGNSPLFRQPKLFPNAAAVLGRVHNNFRMIAVTIGNREAQQFKIRQSGLDPIFDEVIVTPNDDKAVRVREVIADLNIDARLSAFIGNSRRSDGQCMTETNFIHLPLEEGWQFDHCDLPANTGFQLFEPTTWLEAEERAIERLLRQREMRI
ncbi:MAG TPA: HAD family hydrolase [Drouetiella sp.]|jgi:putative hydrolase of the HAD superfamily